MDKFLSVSTFTRIDHPRVNLVFDTLSLLINFNTNVAIIALAESEFMRAPITML